MDKGLDQQGGSPPQNGLGGEAPTHWLSLALVIDFDGTETAGVSEEKGDRRQDSTTDVLLKGFPMWGSSMVKSSRDWGAEGKAPVSAGMSPFDVTTAQSGASEKLY